MPPIQYKSYPSMPPFGYKFRPADWPADEEYNEVFQLEDTGNWFAAMYDKNGGGQRTSAKDSKEEAEAAVYEHITFIRSFWDQKVEWMNNGDMTIPEKGRREKPSRVVRMDGYHYVIGEEPPGGKGGAGWGHGGREFHIKLKATGEVVVTHNLWSQGEIPAEYRDVLADNAEDVTPPYKPLSPPVTFL